MRLALAAALLLAACSSSDVGGAIQPICAVSGLATSRILVPGVGVTNTSCRDAICPHNENTDMIRWNGAIYLVHRTAVSQVLGPNSSLHIYRSTDEGGSFDELAHIPAINDRDIRDPSFYIVGDMLYLKAITRVAGGARDADTHSISVGFRSANGTDWENFGDLGPEGWSFWRVVAQGGKYYAAAYQDGDLQVVLYTSDDGVHFSAGPVVYGVSADTPLETELIFVPSGKLLALVRMDGTDEELLGDQGRLRTKVCWASPPFASFDCSRELSGERLDGPVAFFDGARLFVVARRHLQPTLKKRTTLFELTGNLDGGDLAISDWGDFQSAGDTSYAGVASLGSHKFLVSWYASNLVADAAWSDGILGPADIRMTTADLSELPPRPTPELCPAVPDAGFTRSPDAGFIADGGCDKPANVLCGTPCDVGNELGVGKYCQVGDDCAGNQSATVCSASLNGLTSFSSFICTFICDPSDPPATCGTNAGCLCFAVEGVGSICGCAPNYCSLPDGGL